MIFGLFHDINEVMISPPPTYFLLLSPFFGLFLIYLLFYAFVFLLFFLFPFGEQVHVLVLVIYDL